MATIKEKIEKLLALSGSANENEARAALLKAQELMAKYKMSDADFAKLQKRNLVHLECGGVEWTTDSGNIWMVNVAKVLCDNYCCVSSWITKHGTRTHTLMITGFEEDAEVCKVAVEYAIKFVLGQIRYLGRKYRNSDPRSYAEGFALGLELAFEEQKDEHPEWGLVVVAPEEVANYGKSLGTKSVRSKAVSFNPLLHLMGQEDGRNFATRKALETN